MDKMKKDARFTKIGNDPRFRRMAKKDRKVKIDSRFKDMFTDKKFKLKYSVDKRGRPIQSTTNEDFRKYYDISDSDDDDDDDGDGDENKVREPHLEKTKTTEEAKVSDENSSDESNVDDEEESPESGLGSGPDLARGEGNVETSSEEEESEEEADDDDSLNLADLDRDAEVVEEATSRLAVCNMDWDRVKAHDIFVLLQSFKPSGGLIKSVKIYPSDFGLERMKIEEVKGPTELTEKSSQESQIEDIDEGDSFHTEKLRKYQLNRLRYYYAVVECDSVETASKIYEECDGMEYESSSNKLDLRFIPEDMSFDHEPKAVCTELPASYNPSLFFTTALCQSKVDLTWDETDHDRLKVTMNPSMGKMSKKGKTEIKEEDFKAYLASSSDEDEEGPIPGLDLEADSSGSEDEETQINKYRNLVQSIKESEEQKKKRDVEMEISWEPGLKESTEKMIQKKEKEKDMTVWDKYLDKKKEKKLKKKGQKKERVVDKEEDSEAQSDVEAFSDDEIPDDVAADPFFKHSDDEDHQTNKKKKGKKKKKKTGVEDEQDTKSKAELSLLMMDNVKEEDEKKHFSLKKLVEDGKTKKKKKRKKKQEDGAVTEDFKVNTTDPRFEALFTHHLYNIDPSAPEYKKTKAMKDIVEAKQQFRKTGSKRKAVDQSDATSPKTAKSVYSDNSLQKLIESVKTKTKQFKTKKLK